MSSSYPQNDILNQCHPDADVLLDNFRNDVSCEVLKQFQKRGITLDDLLELQKIIPAVYPWDKEYDSLRYIVNRRFISFPMTVVMCRTTKDVRIAVKWAYKNKIPIVPRGGSHCFENFSLTSGMIVDQSRRTDIIVKDNIAILDPGCLQGPVQLELSKWNLAFVGGTCENVGAAALSLGGGMGFLTRKFGLACDNLLEVEIVLSRGDIIKANKEKHKDLFWALRGGGLSNYGIVTRLVFKVHHVPKVVVFDIIFPYYRLKEVIEKWQHWAPFTVNELTSELDVFNDRIVVTGQFIGDKESFKRLVKPILKLNPQKYQIDEIPFIEAVRKFAGKGYWFPFFKNKSGFVKNFFPLPALEVIEKYMKCGGSEDHVEMNALGGIMNKIPSNATAFPHRKGTLYWVHLQCHWSSQDISEFKLKWVNDFYNELEPYLTGAYANAPDLDLTNPLEKYYGLNLPRLKEIKKKYNPENIFWYPQAI